MTMERRRGPLAGLRVIEMAGVGPGAFAAMWFADMGAEVLRIDRAGADSTNSTRGLTALSRGRPRIELDLKQPPNVELALTVLDRADALVDGFRPGVMERLGLGPEVAHARNPRLVYGRLTGFGQDGPAAHVAGHDINFLARSGVLGAIRRVGERPMFPLTLVADTGGGALLLAVGMLAAILESRSSGRGQVVDASMVEGAALLSTVLHDFRAMGTWSDEPGTNMLDSGAHFYEVYETADDRYLAVGAVEPQFYALLVDHLGLSAAEAPQFDRRRWPELKTTFARIFRARTLDEWTAEFGDDDVCVTSVLSPGEATTHPHNVARNVFVERGGVTQPAPAPRLSRTPGEIADGPHAAALLSGWGVDAGLFETSR
jgi:alpha-methylacyl-CoA racemase